MRYLCGSLTDFGREQKDDDIKAQLAGLHTILSKANTQHSCFVCMNVLTCIACARCILLLSGMSATVHQIRSVYFNIKCDITSEVA